MIADTRILIVEDNQSDADLLRRELKKSGLLFIAEVVQTRITFEQALENFKPDIILSDYSLPAFDAVTAFHIKQVNYPDTPFIIVSGIIGEENAVELIKSGVTDYASKSRLFSLSVKITRALNDARVKKEKQLTDKKLQTQTAELIFANGELENVNKLVQTINGELLQLNLELEDRVNRRTQALTESEHRFRNMMETIPQIAWTNTIDGKFIFYNFRWYNYTGLTENTNKISGLKTAVHPDDLAKSSASFIFIRQKGEGGEFQLRLKRSDGLYRWHLIRVMPIKNESGDLELWVGTATDIEELRLLQQQKDDFISIASHELKTPLTSLKAALQLLLQMKDNPSLKMLPMIILANKSLEKVNLLVEDLLNTSKLNEGQLSISPKEFVLDDMIRDSCQYIRTEGIYTIVTEGDMGVEVYADAIRIDQVITNFVTNAIKYAPDSKLISIVIEKSDKMVKVSVSDYGAGIPLEKQRFVFDRYYRVDNSGSQYTGLGLGLYICAEIIKIHHGEIGVFSEVGKGSTFWFSLPVPFRAAA